MKKFFTKLVRHFFGFCVNLLFLPFYAVLWIFYGIGIACQDFWYFSRDFTKSITDPDYIPPIGLSGMYALRGLRQKAKEAEVADDRTLAYQYWQKCTAYYDNFAMLKVAENFDLYDAQADQLDEESKDRQISEWYAIAASFGNTRAEQWYADQKGSPLDDKQKRWIRSNFIQNRRSLLKDQNSSAE